jgi:peroxiredoxin
MMTTETPFWRRLLSWQRLREGIVYLLIFIVAGFVGNLWMTRDQAGGLAPVTTATTLGGEKISFLAEPAARKQQSALTLLYFFAEWCPVCKLQNSTISELAQDFNVIGIAMQSGDDRQVQAYLAEHEIDFSVVNDATGRISRAYGVDGVPATFIVDANGKIQYSTRGYATAAGLRSRLWLSELSDDS